MCFVCNRKFGSNETEGKYVFAPLSKTKGMFLTYRDFLKIEKKNEQKLGRKMDRRPEQTVQRKRKENGP